MPLHNLIVQRIRESGAISVAEYMELALSHPEHGYYMHRDPFGSRGDFTTAPEISQIFGELIGAWAAMLWAQMGGGEIALIELGPGRGTLMRDALRATRNIPSFHDHICVSLVDMSPNLRRIQQSTLKDIHPRIHWHPDLEELPDMPAIFIANEFFDALPIHQYIRTHEGLKEKMVDIDPEQPEKLRFTIKQLGLSLVKGGAYSDDGVVIETCPAAREVMYNIAAHIKAYGGAGLAIDYGYTGGSRGNTLQAVKKHGFHPVLEEAGHADITAHVDFDMLTAAAEESGIHAHGVISQGNFLMRLGAELRTQVLLKNASDAQKEEIITSVKRLIMPEYMGELFKVMSFTADPNIIPAGFEQ
jgi:NADH dehydrogenase [ubiquinone] 1 alpha subcomplex assembly factor 7